MAAPTISSISPQLGSIYGGTTVAVIGSGFSVSLPKVYFGDLLGTAVSVADDTHLTVVSPRVDGIVEADLRISTLDGSSESTPIAARFYYFDPLSSPSFVNNNLYWDPGANYTFFGNVVFVKSPTFISGGGGGGFDPSLSYNTSGNWLNTGDWSFGGGFEVSSPTIVPIQGSSIGILAAGMAGDVLIQSTSGNIMMGAAAGGMAVQVQTGFDFTAVTGSFNFNIDDNVNINSDTLTCTQTSDAIFNAAGTIVLNPTTDLVVTIASVASSVGVPAVVPPVGYSHVLRNNTTGQLRYMT